MPALKKASVGELTTGNKDKFVAAEKGQTQEDEVENIAERKAIRGVEAQQDEMLFEPKTATKPQVIIRPSNKPK